MQRGNQAHPQPSTSSIRGYEIKQVMMLGETSFITVKFALLEIIPPIIQTYFMFK